MAVLMSRVTPCLANTVSASVRAFHRCPRTGAAAAAAATRWQSLFIGPGSGGQSVPRRGLSSRGGRGRGFKGRSPRLSMEGAMEGQGGEKKGVMAALGDFTPKLREGRKKKAWEGPFAYHEEAVMKVESLTNLGMGVCRTEGGWVIMVPAVIPGETVRLRVYRSHKNYSEADLVEVIEPHPARITPQCKLFGVCGGCQYQHMTLEEQRGWKARHVQEVLEKNGPGMQGLEVCGVLGSEHAYGYRNKLTPHHDKPKLGELPEIGFLRQGSRALVDVPHCPIATPAINSRLERLRQEARDAAKANYEATLAGIGGRKAKGATLFLRETEQGVVTDTRETVSDTVGGVTFRYTAGEFFQNNAYALPLMVHHVVTQAKAPLPDTGIAPRYLVDAYCGGGLFCLSAAKHFESCYGVEISELAVASATSNAQLNGITNAGFSAGTASDIFGTLPPHMHGKETVVIIDPPRKGCDEVFLNQLFRFRPARVVYVSCDPATQARDAKLMVEAGYVMQTIQPVDLFPQTRHIENVITFLDGGAPQS